MVAEMMTKTTRILIACLLDFSIYLLIISNIYDHEKYVDNVDALTSRDSLIFHWFVVLLP